MKALNKTPLHDSYKRYGGKIEEIEGWALPEYFEGVEKECQALTKNAGLFDGSHIGKIEIKGEDALLLIENLITGDINSLKDKEIMHTLMCYPFGAILEAVVIYRINFNHFMLVINSANIKKIFNWIINKKRNQNVSIINITNSFAHFVIRGPKAQKVLQKFTQYDLNKIKYLQFERGISIGNIKCIISRSDIFYKECFEIFTTYEKIEFLWEKLLAGGKEEGIKPYGVKTKDIFRIDQAPSFGCSFLGEITPFEAGLGNLVELEKEDFVGKKALIKQNKVGIKRKVVKFQTEGRTPPSSGNDIMSDGKRIGIVIEGHFSPLVNKNIGLALIDLKYCDGGNNFLINGANGLVEANILIEKKKVRFSK